MAEEKKENSPMVVQLATHLFLREKVKCGKCDMNQEKWLDEGKSKGTTENPNHYFFHMVAALGFHHVRLPKMIRLLREIRNPANFKIVFEIEQNRLDINAEKLYTLGHELNTTVRCRSCGHLGRVVYMPGKPGVSGWPHQKAILGDKFARTSISKGDTK